MLTEHSLGGILDETASRLPAEVAVAKKFLLAVLVYVVRERRLTLCVLHFDMAAHPGPGTSRNIMGDIFSHITGVR